MVVIWFFYNFYCRNFADESWIIQECFNHFDRVGVADSNFQKLHISKNRKAYAAKIRFISKFMHLKYYKYLKENAKHLGRLACTSNKT